MLLKEADSIYIHIPFCEHVCSYCDFPKLFSNEKMQKAYISALEKDLSETVPSGTYKTMYLGGGTPTALSDALFSSFLAFLKARYTISGEFTSEANPESMSLTKAMIMKENGVNRVSMGLQSINPEVLRILDRPLDSPLSFRKAKRNLIKAGIDNISADFIYGVKCEKEEDLEKEIRFIRDEELNHVSFYALQIEPHTRLYASKGVCKDDDALRAEYDLIRRELLKIGLARYEVSSFSRAGYQSRHNLTYWHQDPYYGVGLGATGFYNHVRRVRTAVFKAYCSGENLVCGQTKETPSDEEFDFLMLGLRLDEGISLKEYASRFDKDFLKEYKDAIKKLSYRLVIKDGRVRVRKDDIYVLDSILIELLRFPSEGKGSQTSL